MSLKIINICWKLLSLELPKLSIIKTLIMKTLITTLLFLAFSTGITQAQGYYKDIFMDGGIKLTSREDLPAARRLGLSIEHFVSGKDTPESPLTLQDTIIQQMLFGGSEIDHNGVLLYPDGEPRFRLLYVNGGKATLHGLSLTAKGRENIRTFVKNGGNYLGTCAGMFLATNATTTDSLNPKPAYLHIWPALAHSTRLAKTPTGHFVEPGSPLLKYYDFGGDMHIDSVYHNGGGFAFIPGGFPDGTEILTRYDYEPYTKDSLSIHKQISSWAWKESEHSGRVLLTGSHPESYTSGERLDMMSAMILYAMEGSGTPVVKGELVRGEVRRMDKSTLDNDPLHTKIGDRQYHHFTVQIPEGASNIKVELKGVSTCDLNLYMNKGNHAFAKVATIMDISKGAEKTIQLNSLEPGTWYIAVECASTVQVTNTQWGETYTGNLTLLNGTPYTITITWN